jgi:hypothetical protein
MKVQEDRLGEASLRILMKVRHALIYGPKAVYRERGWFMLLHDHCKFIPLSLLLELHQ